AVLVGLFGIQRAMQRLPMPLLEALGGPLDIMIATAVVLDILGEARARRAPLAPAAVVHQVQYLGVLERVLGDAGIAYHVHAGHLRTLLAFFGPWAPAIVLVPADRAAEAQTRLANVLPPSRLPIARVQQSPADRISPSHHGSSRSGGSGRVGVPSCQ